MAGIEPIEVRGAKGHVILDPRRWPFLVASLFGELDASLVYDWHEAYRKLACEQNSRFVYVLDGTAGLSLPAGSRRVISEFLENYMKPNDLLFRLHIGSIYALPSQFMRGIATAIFWLEAPKYKWKFSASLLEAERIAATWFSEEGIEWQAGQRPTV